MAAWLSRIMGICFETAPKRRLSKTSDATFRDQSEQFYSEQLVHFGKLLHTRSFVAATDGNLSVRLDAHRLLVSPTGISKGSMEPCDSVTVDINGNKLAGHRNVSSEIDMHLTIYRMRPDVHAVVHAHPCTATGFASAGIPLDQPLCSEVLMTLGSIPLAPYGTTGTPELSQTLIPFIPMYNAILMANHGVVVYGKDLSEAYHRMETVEHFAKIALVTHHLGKQALLNDIQIEKLQQARSRYLQEIQA